MEHGPLLDLNGAAGPELSSRRLGSGLLVRHVENDVTVVRPRKGKLHDLVEGHDVAGDGALPTVHDDFKGLWRADGGVEPLNTSITELDGIALFDEPVLTTPDIEKNALVIRRLRQGVEGLAGDGREAPTDLAIIQCEAEAPVGAKSHEPLYPLPAKVEGLVEPHVLEIARREDCKEAVLVKRLVSCDSQDLTAEGHGVVERKGTIV